MNPKLAILCVDDEKIILDSLEDQINARFKGQVECEVAERAEDAFEIFDELVKFRKPVAVVIADHVMPGMKGDEFLKIIHQKSPNTLKIMLSGQMNMEVIRSAVNNSRLFRYFPKPWDELDLMLTLEEALEFYQNQIQIAEFHVYTRLLRSLNQAAREISSEFDIQRLIDKFLQIAIDCTDAHRGILLLRNESDSELKVEALSTAGQKEANRLKVFTDQEVEVLTNFILNNIELLLDSDFVNPMQLAANIVHKDRNWGYIYLEQGRSGKFFSAYHREILDMLASQAAISIKNAHLYNKIQLNAEALRQEKEKVEQIKQILEKQNDDITDSIRYAKRILTSFMPPPDQLKEYLPQSFVLLKPRDIVSGDFYWWAKTDHHFIMAAADCTGHGVPGALMSIIGSTFFNQIVEIHAETQPERILEYLDKQVRKALNQNELTTETLDGMDLALCVFDHRFSDVYFAGANRPLFLIRDEEIYEFSGDKLSIGGRKYEGRPFKFRPKRIPLKHGDTIYIFSDGFTDQFGGENHKKFTSKRFKQTLMDLLKYPVVEHGERLEKVLEEWRGEIKQTDDVLVIGFRITYF